MTAVLPFIDMAGIYGDRTSVRNPVTAKVFFTGPVDEDATGMMTHALYRLVGIKNDIISENYMHAPLEPQYRAQNTQNDHLAQLRSIGRRQKADTVLAGYLYAFRDRTGSSYGVNQPARVAFELVLIRVDTGRIIWQRAFKETQKSLSEDLTKLGAFIKRRARWISAREMGTGALEEMLQTLPPSGSP